MAEVGGVVLERTSRVLKFVWVGSDEGGPRSWVGGGEEERRRFWGEVVDLREGRGGEEREMGRGARVLGSERVARRRWRRRCGEGVGRGIVIWI